MTEARQSGLGRLAIALGLAIVVVVIVLAVAGAGGGAATPPATGAARVVPADVLAYVNVSLDRRRPSVGSALALARRLPNVGTLVSGLETRLGALSGTGGGFAQAVRPWAGNEAALAVVRETGQRAGAFVVLAVRERRAFEHFLSQAHAAGGIAGSGVAAVGRYAVIGSAVDIARARAAAAHASASLAADPVYRRATAGEPAARVADAYLPASGLAALGAGRGGVLGAAATLLDHPALEGVSASFIPRAGGAGGVRIQVHEVDAATAPRAASTATSSTATSSTATSSTATSSTGASSGGASSVVPSLQRVIPAGAALLVDVPNLVQAAPRLLAAAGTAGVGGQVGPLLHRLGAALHSEGVNVAGVESLFSGESAVTVTSVATRPALLVLSRTTEPGVARVQLAALEPYLARLFPPAANGPGAEPVFSGHTVAGVDVHTLRLAPGLQLSYAVFGHLIAISTSAAAIGSVASRTHAVAGESRFTAVLGQGQPRVTSLVFLDLSQLIRLGEQTGLLRGTSLRLIAPDLGRVSALGLRSTSGKHESTSELFLSIP